MYSHPRLVGILGCAATLALVGCATNGSTTPTTGSTTSAQVGTTHLIHYMPTRNAAPTVGSHSAAYSGLLFSYYGGPVLLKPKVYVIFWGYKKYGDPDKVAPLLKEYTKVEGGSPHNNIYTQYYDIVGSQKNYITNPKDQQGAIWFDEKNPVPTSPNDAQVAQESLNGVAKFGYDVNASYIVATPHGHNTQGFGTGFCAYHSNVQDGANVVSYTNLPYMPDAGIACGSNDISPPKDESGTDEGVTIVAGHEYGESITDPFPNTGWYSFEAGEIGDACAWYNVQNISFGKKSYSTQPMYSNASESCVQTYK
jgi:hypothetical protein